MQLGSFRIFSALFASEGSFRSLYLPWLGVAKVRKEASFRERKVPFAKGRFWLRKEDVYYARQKKNILISSIFFSFNVCSKRNSTD